MRKIPYASIIGSLNYAQVCTRSDMAHIVGILSRYLSNSSMVHWKAAKQVIKHLQTTKHYMLTYRRSDYVEIIGHSYSSFVGCHDSRVYSMS